ncbi:MAG: hypothetical protein AAF682_04365 [Planctomycetota bacterium]
MLGDGAGLATFYARGDTLAYHFLFLPACRLVAPLAGILPGGDAADPIEATRVLSAVAAGVGAGATWLLTRELGAGALAGLLATLLVALSPAAAFFGTTVEVHALHYGVVALAAWLTLRLPWRVPAVALPLAAGLFGLAFWAHQLALLLGPGWILLCQLGRERVARPFAARTLLLVAGPALLLGALAASALASYVRYGSPLPSAGEEADILRDFARPPGAWRFLWDGWLFPLALLVPAAAAGLWRGGGVPRVRLALGLSCAFPLAFLVSWGVSEYGGYALGHAPFLACLAALALGSSPRGLALGALLVLIQAGLGIWNVRSFDRGWDVNERVELVREHLGGGVFAATVDNAPAVAAYFPLTEVYLWEAVARASEAGLSEEEIVATLIAQARQYVEQLGRVVLDLGFETQHDRGPIAQRLPYFEPLAHALARELRTTRIEHPHWPLLIVEPRLD